MLHTWTGSDHSGSAFLCSSRGIITFLPLPLTALLHWDNAWGILIQLASVWQSGMWALFWLRLEASSWALYTQEMDHKKKTAEIYKSGGRIGCVGTA